MHETETGQIRGAVAIDVRRDGHIMASEKNLLGFLNALFKKGRRDRALINIEEGHIVVGDLVKKDDEFNEVRVRLLPERFLTATEKIVQKRSDVICKRVRIEIVVKRVVAVVGIETDFDVIVGPAMTGENLIYLLAEVAFHFEVSPPTRFSLSPAL